MVKEYDNLLFVIVIRQNLNHQKSCRRNDQLERFCHYTVYEINDFKLRSTPRFSTANTLTMCRERNETNTIITGKHKFTLHVTPFITTEKYCQPQVCMRQTLWWMHKHINLIQYNHVKEEVIFISLCISDSEHRHMRK